MENPINPCCVICGQTEGKPFECVTAYRTTTAYKRRRKGNTKYVTSYSQVKRHAGCVCDACRRKGRLIDIKNNALMLVVSVAILVVLGLVIHFAPSTVTPEGNRSIGILGSLAVLAVIPCSIFSVVALASLLGCLRGNHGSETLGTYYLRKHKEMYPGDSGYTYMTIKKAQREHLI